MNNGQPNELNELIAEPSLPISNGDMVETLRIFEGEHLSIYQAAGQILFEFTDTDGFTNGISVDQDVDEKEFIRVMQQFAEYAGA